MLSIANAEEENETIIYLRPNASASLNLNHAMIALLALPVIIIAGFFSALGFWLVVPFAGVDLVLFLFIVNYFFRKNAQKEIIRFSPHQVIIEKFHEQQCLSSVQLPRVWTTVIIEKTKTEYDRGKIYFRAYGKHFEVGNFLGRDELSQLAIKLRELVQRYN